MRKTKASNRPERERVSHIRAPRSRYPLCMIQSLPLKNCNLVKIPVLVMGRRQPCKMKSLLLAATLLQMLRNKRAISNRLRSNIPCMMIRRKLAHQRQLMLKVNCKGTWMRPDLWQESKKMKEDWTTQQPCMTLTELCRHWSNLRYRLSMDHRPDLHELFPRMIVCGPMKPCWLVKTLFLSIDFSRMHVSF